jgi:hypothetical protein
MRRDKPGRRLDHLEQRLKAIEGALRLRLPGQTEEAPGTEQKGAAEITLDGAALALEESGRKG